MRKLMYLLPMLLLFGVNLSGAQDYSSASITSAQNVASAKDEQAVTLRGAIVGKQSSNQYLLSDDSGSVLVEISEKLLNGNTLATGTEVEIVGEVDRRFLRSPKVEARSVTVLASSGRKPMNEESPGAAPEERG